MRTLRMIRAVGVCGAVAAAGGCATGALMQQELTKTNTQTVLAFEETVFNKHEVREAFDHYVASSFVQHTPQLTTDRRAALAAYEQLVTRQYPMSRMMVERTIAGGDMVVTQARWQSVVGRSQPAEVVDIFRLSGGRITEHWNVVQQGPAALASNPAQAE